LISVGLYVACVFAATLVGIRETDPPRRAQVSEEVWTSAGHLHLEWGMRPADRLTLMAAGRSCAVSRTQGDFDGDSVLDLALVYPRSGSCDYRHTSGRYVLTVVFATGRELTRSLEGDVSQTGPICRPLCQTFAAPDFDLDGRAELAILFGRGASQVWFGVYRIGRGSIRQVTVKRPREEKKPAEFHFFGSVCCGSDVVCRRASDGAALVVQSSYGQGIWTLSYREDVYVFDGRGFVFQSSREETRAFSSGTAPRGRRCVRPDERILGLDPLAA
jgi:hypothetical protein